MELEQSIPVVQIKGSLRDSVWTSEFHIKYLKKAKGHIGQNFVIITKMRSIVQNSSNSSYKLLEIKPATQVQILIKADCIHFMLMLLRKVRINVYPISHWKMRE